MSSVRCEISHSLTTLESIHLLRLSDGTSHGEMKISSSARTLTGLITMRFEGDILGVARYCLTGEILDLYLFNWKNGSLVAVSFMIV